MQIRPLTSPIKFEPLLGYIMIATMFIIVAAATGLFLYDPADMAYAIYKGYYATTVYLWGYWAFCLFYWGKLCKHWLHSIALAVSAIYFCFSYLIWGVSITPQVIY